MKILGIVLGLLLFSVSNFVCAASVHFTWDVSTDDVLDYRLYYGESSEDYGSYVSVPKEESDEEEVDYELDHLQARTPYFFSLTAHNSVGESGHSEEISGVPSLINLTDEEDARLCLECSVENSGDKTFWSDTEYCFYCDVTQDGQVTPADAQCIFNKVYDPDSLCHD